MTAVIISNIFIYVTKTNYEQKGEIHIIIFNKDDLKVLRSSEMKFGIVKEYQYADRYYVKIENILGSSNFQMQNLKAPGPVASIISETILLKNDIVSEEFDAKQLDLYVENAYLCKAIAEYAMENLM